MNPGLPTCTARALTARPETGHGAARSALVALVGGSLLVVGVIGLVLPLPGVLLIATGLSVLGTRFATPRRWLESLQRGVARLRALRG